MARSMSVPSRYQASRRRQANVCRRSWRRGRARPTGDDSRHGLPQQLVERVPHGRVGQRPAGVRHEEGRVPRLPVAASVTGRGIVAKRPDGASCAGGPAGTCGTWSGGSVRTPASRSTSPAPRVEGLGDPQPGAGQQPDQGGVRPGAQAVGRGERPGRLDQRGDIGLGVEERRPAGVGRAEQPAGRDLGARLARARYRASVRTTSSRRAWYSRAACSGRRAQRRASLGRQRARGARTRRRSGRTTGASAPRSGVW